MHLQSAAQKIGRTALALSLAMLTACAPSLPPPPAPGAGPQMVRSSPIPAPKPNQKPAAPLRSEPLVESAELARRYDAFEGRMVSQGMLRDDPGGLDDLTPEDLATNFLRIALYDEYTPSADGTLIAQEGQSRLRRWDAPVEIGLHFGASVSEPQRARDRDTVTALSQTLTEATGHPVRLGRGPGNFTVFVVDETERLGLAPELQALVPGITDPVVASMLDILPSTFCLVVAFSSPATPYVYARAIAIIRAEHPQRLRQSCFHEEIAQGMGLANDSRAARPSIFNDDEEFALLTDQDRLLLGMLYDPRLRPGMDLSEAEPVVQMIAGELLGQELVALQSPPLEDEVLN